MSKPSTTRPTRSRSCWTLAALVTLVLAAPGCTALAKYDRDADPAPFSATQNGLGALYLVTTGFEPERPDPFDFVLHPLTLPAWIGNLPLALVADAVTLPYDLCALPGRDPATPSRWEKFRARTCAD